MSDKLYIEFIAFILFIEINISFFIENSFSTLN